MVEQNSPPRSHPVPSGRRRDSLTGQTFSDLFSRSSPSSGGFSGTITSAAAQAQRRRRLSLSTVGLSGSMQASPTQQPSPFLSRSDSLSTSNTSATSASVDENPFEETDVMPMSGNPSTPFARRMSFGARALRDVKHGSGNGSGTSISMEDRFFFALNVLLTSVAHKKEKDSLLLRASAPELKDLLPSVQTVFPARPRRTLTIIAP